MGEMLLAKREGEKESPYAPSLQTPLLLENLLQKITFEGICQMGFKQ